MGTALSDNDPLDGRAATRAGQIRAAKHPQLIFVAAAMATDRVKIGFTGSQRGAEIFQAPFEHPRNGPVQRLDLVCRKTGGDAVGMQFRIPQRFIDINIAESGHKGLIQQQRFQSPPVPPEAAGQNFHGKVFFQRLRPQAGQNSGRIIVQVDAPEFTGVMKSQLPVIIELDDYMFMFDARRGGRDQMQASGHSKMEQHGLFIVGLKDQVFSPASDGGKSTAFQPLAE